MTWTILWSPELISASLSCPRCASILVSNLGRVDPKFGWARAPRIRGCFEIRQSPLIALSLIDGAMRLVGSSEGAFACGRKLRAVLQGFEITITICRNNGLIVYRKVCMYSIMGPGITSCSASAAMVRSLGLGWRPVLWGRQAGFLLESGHHRTQGEGALQTAVVCTWTLLEGEEPVQGVIAHDLLQIFEITAKIKYVLPR